MIKSDHYPMPQVFCGAKTRCGGTCRQPAMKNGRCRLHGGKSKSGKDHGRYRHGNRTKEAIEARRQAAALLKESKRLLIQIMKDDKKEKSAPHCTERPGFVWKA